MLESMNLTPEQEKCLVWIENSDHRSINDDLLNAIVDSQGSLHEFLKCVLEHNKDEKDQSKKLSMLLRGNSNNVIVYYRNHVLWELSLVSGQGNVEFNFNHARYTEDWKKQLEILQNEYKMGCNAEIKATNTGITIDTISARADKFDKSFVKYTHDTFIEFIETYFGNRGTRKDYFKSENSNSNPRFYVEKDWQQRLYFYFNSEFEDKLDHQEDISGTYIYDLEFSQPYPDENSRELFGKNNEPDMLGISFEDGVPKSLQFIEVMSNESSCEGDSGIKKHIEGMRNYAGNPRFMKCRAKDLIQSLRQYAKMGLFKGDMDLLSKVETFCKSNEIPVELFIVLTNNELPVKRKETKKSAIDYYHEHKNEVESWLKDPNDRLNCRLQIVEGNFFEGRLEIKEIKIN